MAIKTNRSDYEMSHKITKTKVFNTLIFLSILFLFFNGNKGFASTFSQPEQSLYSIPSHEFDNIINAAPKVLSHTIDYDSTNDGLGPCNDDYPNVTATITDSDGYIDYTWLWYYIDTGGFSWIIMTQSVSNETKWFGSLPKCDPESIMHWWIQAFDNEGNDFEYFKSGTSPWTYTVINRLPVIELLYPTGGEVITSNTLNISWHAYDLDIDTLTFGVKYSYDNETWETIQLGLTEQFCVWDLSGIENSDTVFVRVSARDSYEGETKVISAAFSINKTDTSGSGLLSILIISTTALISISVYKRKEKLK